MMLQSLTEWVGFMLTLASPQCIEYVNIMESRQIKFTTFFRRLPSRRHEQNNGMALVLAGLSHKCFQPKTI